MNAPYPFNQLSEELQCEITRLAANISQFLPLSSESGQALFRIGYEYGWNHALVTKDAEPFYRLQKG